MELTKNMVVATFAAVVIGGLSISPTSEVPHQTGHVDSKTLAGFEVRGDSIYANPRSVLEGSQLILTTPSMRSNSKGRIDGRQG
jgi:hypothetical protein